MSEEEQKYFKGLIGFTFDSDDIKYIEKIVDKKDKEIERLQGNIEILVDDLGNIGYMLDLEEGSCYEDVLEEIRILQKENKKLHSIIKEVREYMKTLSDEYASDDYDIKCDVFCKIFYEILDKENNHE